MRILLVCRHLPELEGSATGRVLRATADGLVALGHEIRVVSWRPERPDEELPSYAAWRPIPGDTRWRAHARALLRPRNDAAHLGLDRDWADVALAEEQVSWAAVARHPGAALVCHHSVRLDAAALRRRDLPVVQDLRNERHATRAARTVLALSRRVARAVGGVAVPVGLHLPDEAVPPVEAPVASVLADWRWPANVVALGTLMRAWPEVRERLPAAQLLVAGRGDPRLGHVPGVTFVGSVRNSRDVLARTAVAAFPSPPTSGPKVKVLEALAAGVPVVTTPGGAEGIADADAGAVVAEEHDFAAALAGLLADPGRRLVLSRDGRSAVRRNHSPEAAAAARVAALFQTAMPS